MAETAARGGGAARVLLRCVLIGGEMTKLTAAVVSQR
jgi:hypothetical protein